MLAAAGNPVVTLRRLQIGALRLPENSEPGTWRELSEEEKAKVFL
jgi:16S rRNA U516 pseudouridylate synthase RsuA-like enzyme